MAILAWIRAAAIGALLVASAGTWAIDAVSVPAAKQTKANLYFASEEAAAFLAARNGRVLFVDVRTPGELQSDGSTPLIDANVPVKLGSFPAALEANPAFVTGVERRLAAKGLSKSDPVVVMCRSGVRSAAAANLLADAGFTRVYSVVDGFEGWKSKELPWGYNLDPAKLTVH